jgi:hypothetical protein
MVIRAALTTRAGHRSERFERVPNAALVPLDPAAVEQEDIGGDAVLPAS